MVDADDTHTGLWHKLPTGELKTTNHAKYHQIMAHTKEEALNIKLTLEILVGEINIFIRLVCIEYIRIISDSRVYSDISNVFFVGIIKIT